jgi:hypothetical protein
VITSIIDEFAFSLPLDNGLLITEVQNGVLIAERDVIDVVINARALFTLTTLTCRQLARVEDCFKLWAETRELLTGLLNGWAQVEASDHPRVAWLLTELRHLQALCEDRCELYTITRVDRRHHVEIRGDVDFGDSFSQRHGQEAKGWADHSSPAHVYSVGHF